MQKVLMYDVSTLGVYNTLLSATPELVEEGLTDRIVVLCCNPAPIVNHLDHVQAMVL